MAANMDVVDLLKQDHEKVETLLNRLDLMSDTELEEYFCEVRETLVRHEVAEEIVVYPAFRRAEPGAENVADQRISEQSKAEEKLAELEDVHDPIRLREGLTKLRTEVLAHAMKEEAEVFPLLEHDLDSDELTKLGSRYQKALDVAPTHPHPHAPDKPPGNLLLGPVAAMVDRLRDAMSSASKD